MFLAVNYPYMSAIERITTMAKMKTPNERHLMWSESQSKGRESSVNKPQQCIPGRQFGHERPTAAGPLRRLHMHLALAQLLQRHRIARMSYQGFLRIRHTMRPFALTDKQGAFVITLTIAKVAFESVSSRSEAASRLACSISRRFFLMFSRCISAAGSVDGEYVAGW